MPVTPRYLPVTVQKHREDLQLLGKGMIKDPLSGEIIAMGVQEH
jgi:hypothetical protein